MSWCLLLAAALLQGGEPAGRSFWLPPRVSTVAEGVDSLFYLILAIALFFFALIVVLIVLFVWKYRRRREDESASGHAIHNTALEVTWTVIPVGLVILIFILGFRGFLDMSTPPANATEVLVEAQRWSWSFTYPNGYVDSDLHVPVDRPVRLVMSSRDVIHSFFVPAFRVKRDVVPGRYNITWFEATEPGEYQVFCAEYCGTSHSTMLAKVVVHPPGGYEAWLAKASSLIATMSPVEAGARLFKVKGCQQCHTVDDTAKIGPSLKAVFGRSISLASGERVTADESYLRESILEPMTRVVAGYDPVMPTYQGRLDDREITALVEYLKSLAAEKKE